MPRRENKSLRPATSHLGHVVERGVFFGVDEQVLYLFAAGEAFTPITPIPVGSMAYFDDSSIGFPLKYNQSVVFPFKRKVTLTIPPTIEGAGGGAVTINTNTILKFHVASDIDNVFPSANRTPLDTLGNFTFTHQILFIFNVGFPHFVTLRTINQADNDVKIIKSQRAIIPGRHQNDWIKQDNLNAAHLGWPRNGDSCHIVIPENCGYDIIQTAGQSLTVDINLRDFQERQDERKDLIFTGTFADLEAGITSLGVFDTRKYHSVMVYFKNKDAVGSPIGTVSLREYSELEPCNSYVIDSGLTPAGLACRGLRGTTIARFVEVLVELEVGNEILEASLTIVGSYA